MTSSDYADWLRVEQWVGTPFMAGGPINVPNGTTLGPFFVAPWEAVAFTIGLHAGDPGTDYGVVLAFTDPAFPGVFIGGIGYSSFQNLPMADVVPVQGSMLSVIFSGMAAAHDFDITLTPRRGLSAMARQWNGDSLLHQGTNAPAVAAGATITSMLTPIMAADCVWGVWTDAVAWSARLDATTTLGGVEEAIAATGPGAGRSPGAARVFLPSRPVQFSFTNNDAVPRFCNAGVVPRRI